MILFSLKLVAGLREGPAQKQKCTADCYVEYIKHLVYSVSLGLLCFLEKHFVACAPELPGQTLILRWPPSLPTADDHDGTGFQDRGQRFEAIAAQIDLHARLYRNFACDHPKAVLVELHKDRRRFEGERVRHHLRHHKLDPGAQAVR